MTARNGRIKELPSAYHPQRGNTTDDAFIVYGVMAEQMQQHDLLMWQVPVLSLTAQAFLMTIVLGGGSARTSRLLAALLALLASILSMQLMAKHRWHVTVERAWLVNFEREHQLDPIHEIAKNSGQPPPRPAEQQWLRRAIFHQLTKPSSFFLWQLGLGLFGIVAALCLVLAIVRPSLLNH